MNFWQFLLAKVWNCGCPPPSYHHVYFCALLFLCPCWHKMSSPLSPQPPLQEQKSPCYHWIRPYVQSSAFLSNRIYIFTNAHIDCIQLKPRAGICVYCDFLCQVKESENSICMAQRAGAHWHLSKAEQTELHGSHCISLKAFLPAQVSFSVVSRKLHWLPKSRCWICT